MSRTLIFAAVVLASLSAARAAELDGVSLPDTQLADGKQIRLNGIGLRTYSVFRIHIYVAGLYLEHPSDDAEAILHSTDTKLLDIRFVHDVSAEEARTAWQNGFENNCLAPCQLDPHAVQQFLAAVRPIASGDQATLLFTSSGAEVRTNGQLVGRITDAPFAELILATFLGPVPATPRLKRELLGIRD
jgi:hypothetical protein